MWLIHPLTTDSSNGGSTGGWQDSTTQDLNTQDPALAQTGVPEVMAPGGSRSAIGPE